MFVDSRQLDTKKVIETEICIIGAGAAGITLARRFASKSYRVCLLESGGLAADTDTDALNKAANVGRPYRVGSSRLRYFGGTTNHWGGHCVPIRELNFAPRPWIRDSGWPLSRQELDPYYRRAHEVLGLGEFDYDANTMAASLGLPLFPFDPSRVESVGSRYRLLRFGREYRDELDAAPNITTYLFANVTSIDRHPSRDYVVDVSVKTLTGKSFTVRAKYYVLATGGIENARLLLASNRVEAAGLGNSNGIVGRFFTEHILYPSGLILPANQDSALNLYCNQNRFGENLSVRCHLALPQRVVRQHQIPEFKAEIVLARTDRFFESVSSAQAIKNDLVKPSLPDKLLSHLADIVKDPGPVVRRIFRHGPPLVYLLVNHAEQVPNPDSRVTLSPEKDALGLNRLAVDWRLSELDKIGIVIAQRLIATEVGRTGFGRMRIELPEKEPVVLEGAAGVGHHMGTTRMHANPRLGVVDADCKVHGLANLFIAGSSVFPCCGFSNPTLTIVALALRLGDHLETMVNRRR